MSELGPVVARRTVNAPQETVWAVLSDASARADWWPGTDIELELGGQVSDARGTSGAVDVLVDGLTLGFRWVDAGADTARTVVVMLRPEDEDFSQTRITLIEAGFATLDNAADRVQAETLHWSQTLDAWALAAEGDSGAAATLAAAASVAVVAAEGGAAPASEGAAEDAGDAADESADVGDAAAASDDAEAAVDSVDAGALGEADSSEPNVEAGSEGDSDAETDDVDAVEEPGAEVGAELDDESELDDEAELGDEAELSSEVAEASEVSDGDHDDEDQSEELEAEMPVESEASEEESQPQGADETPSEAVQEEEPQSFEEVLTADQTIIEIVQDDVVEGETFDPADAILLPEVGATFTETGSMQITADLGVDEAVEVDETSEWERLLRGE